MAKAPAIKIEVRKGFCFPKRVTASLGDLHAVGASFTEASKRLVDLVCAKVEHQPESAIVFCVDGTVLVGRTSPDGYTYAMTGPSRDTSWTCGCGLGYDNMVGAMKRHADSCYGGVVAAKRV